MDERYGQVTCDVARDESSPSRVHCHVICMNVLQLAT